MIRVLLVRHGETEWNAAGKMQGRTDIPLSEVGMAQARAAAPIIAAQQPRSAHVSTLVRTQQTLEGFGLDLEPTVWDELAEVGFGEWEGRIGADLRRDYAEEFAQARTGEFTPAGGETIAAVTERMRRAFFEIVRGAADIEASGSADLGAEVRTVLVVSHGSALRLLLVSLGLTSMQTWTPLTNASTTIVDIPLQEGPVSSTLPNAGLTDGLDSAAEAELIRGLTDNQIQKAALLRTINLSPELVLPH